MEYKTGLMAEACSISLPESADRPVHFILIRAFPSTDPDKALRQLH